MLNRTHMVRPCTASHTSSGTTSNSVWHQWNRDYTSTSAYTVTTSSNTSTVLVNNDRIWRIWNVDRTGTASCISDSTDPFLVCGSTTNDFTSIQTWHDWNVPQEAREAARRASAEQREAWQRMEAEQRRLQEEQNARWQAENEARWKKEAEEREKANRRAEELLHACLNPFQKEELEKFNFFHLYVGEKKYRIKRGRTRNIELLDETGRPIKKLCAHPGEYVPDADTMLAQKLMLETDEEAFLKLANHSEIHYTPEPQTVRPSEQVARAI